MASKLRNLFCAVLWLASWMFSSAWAVDIDLFTGNPPATTSDNAPVLMFAWDNRASFSANASETCLLGTPTSGTATSGTPVATALSGKSGGIEQCAIFSVIQSMPTGDVARVRIGIMALWATGMKDYLDNSCTNTSGEGGCVLYPVTPLTTANKVALLTYIKNWTSTGSSLYNIKVNSSAGGPATLMQESWAYLYGKTGLSGRDYSGIRPGAGCGKYFVAYVGNNFGSSAKIVADSGTNAWAALSGTIGTSGMRANPAATTLELTKIRPTSKNATTSCRPPPTITAGQTTDPNGWYADEWTRYMKDQNIQTYTIGLIDSNCDNEYAWILRSMAEYGGGKYFEASNYTQIKTAFETIFSEVQSVNSVFAAVSLPVSVNTQGTYLNQVFVGMFRPDQDSLPRWAGNLKQYKMGYSNSAFRLLDADGNAAISSSGSEFIAECARSFWTPALNATDVYWSTNVEPNCVGYDPRSNSPDGNLVEKGGHAYKLRAQSPASRTMYTCTPGTCTWANFPASTAVSSLTATMVNWQRGQNIGPTSGPGAEPSAELNGVALTATDMRPSAHGDVVHSRPVAVNFGSDTSPRVVVFYGGNDGLLRAINGNREASISAGSSTYSAGSELWSFVPPEFYGKIQRRHDNSPLVRTPVSTTSSGATDKDYGVDGPITAYIKPDNTGPVWLYASMRRGGRNIYAMSVDRSSLAPTWKWRKGCEGSTCSTGFESMGQTWASPTVLMARGYSTTTPLLIVGGGYDATCEDPISIPSTCTTVAGTSTGVKAQPSSTMTGNRIYVLNADTGELLKTFKTFRGVVGDIFILKDADGYATYGYAADLGGNVYRISGASANEPIGNTAPSGWTFTQVAMLGCDVPIANSAIAATTSAEAYGTHCALPESRKFLYGPDVATKEGVNYLMIGSGNREQPLARPSTPTQNYFFVVQDKPAEVDWLSASENDSACGTGNNVLCLNMASNVQVGTCLSTEQQEKKVFAYRLDAYEQVVTSAIAAYGVAYFSTHIPTEPSVNTCSANLGRARAYQLDILKGKSPTKACGADPFTVVTAGGLAPSPVAGMVRLDDGSIIPFVIGATGPLEATQVTGSAGSGTKPTVKTKSYWYIKK